MLTYDLNQVITSFKLSSAFQLPRIDRLLPLQTPDSVLNRVTEGTLTPVEAMDRLILLLASKQAWKLYLEVAPVSWFSILCCLWFPKIFTFIKVTWQKN